MLSHVRRSLVESVGHTSVMLKQARERGCSLWEEEYDASAHTVPFAPPSGPFSPSVFGSLTRETRRWRHANAWSGACSYHTKNICRHATQRMVSTLLRLTVREKANPHLYFSCSLQDLHSLKRKEKWTGRRFWLNKDNISDLWSEKTMIICSLKDRGGHVKVTDNCGRHASHLYLCNY